MLTLADVRVPGDVLVSPVDAARLEGDLESIREHAANAMAQPGVGRDALVELARIMAAATEALGLLRQRC